MSAPGLKANEPSMEEILASIRRIISDDPDKPAPAPAVQAPPAPQIVADAQSAPPEPPAADDVLDLATVAGAGSAEISADIEFRDVGEALILSARNEIEAQSQPPSHERLVSPPPPEPVRDQLLSPQADAAVSQAFNALSSTILTSNSRTLEDLVKDMMRPMLKVWLDENLPALVERLVRAEIERVTRGPRS